MFQLLKFSSSSLKRSLPVSLRSLSENNQLSVTEKTCLLCKHLNVNSRLQLRKQSSVTNPSLNKPQRKRRKKKVFTDVLEVTDQSSRLRKANVTKLTPRDLNLLASTDLSLNELHKLKELTAKNIHEAIYTYSNLATEDISRIENDLQIPVKPTDASSIEPLLNTPQRIDKKDPEVDDTARISDKDLKDEIDVEAEHLEFQIENNLEFKSLAIKNSFHPELEDELPEVAYHEEHKPEKEQNFQHNVNSRHREEVAAKTLASYIEVCNHLKNPQRGLQALYFNQYRAKRLNASNMYMPMKNVNVYCTLLKGFAHKGDYKQLLHVLSMMEEENVEPDLQCYVAIFECLGKLNVQEHYLKDIRIFAKRASSKNITFDQIMNKGVFLDDERSHVLRALQSCDPDYIPKYEKPNICYDNHLLNNLNKWDEELELRKGRRKKGLFTPEMLTSRVEKQKQMEESVYVSIKNIDSKGAPTEEILHYRESLDNHFKMWASAAEAAFQRDLATLSAKRCILNMEPYMRCIPMKDFINIIVEEAKRFALGSETYSPEVSLLYKQLGFKVYSRYQIYQKKKTGVLDKITQIHTEYCQQYANLHGGLSALPLNEFTTNPRVQWQLLEFAKCSEGPTLNMDHQPWVPGTFTAIGKFLYHIIMHDLKVDVNSMRRGSKHKNLLPAFYTIFRSQGRIVKEEIKPHPVLSRLYRSSHPETLTFPAYEIPMVCPPVPWTSTSYGGYISIPIDLVRLPNQASTQKQRIADSDPVHLYPSFDALNQLASVPWKVNTKVLDVILKVFKEGGSSKLDVPEEPSSLPPPPSISPDMDKTEKCDIYKQKLQYKRKKAEMYSLWCDCLYRLSLANHFRNDVFWLPHNMDFRGRVYPAPPHLNHLGSDLARSMLVFAEARPLGPKGFDWLKIHLINLTGLKKRDSIEDRLNYANDMMDLILDSAEKPLTGQKWWANSDEPWQTLACCMEIANIVRSGVDPAKYKSHFPVHQDGSCNGLQHYAALGRDSAGAHSVNLTPSDVPQDVYSAVVALVEEQRAIDEANGIEVAKILNGFVKRKVIKQTIMTTVYGVTRFGARLQIVKQLKDIDDFPKDAVWSASSYLTVMIHLPQFFARSNCLQNFSFSDLTVSELFLPEIGHELAVVIVDICLLLGRTFESLRTMFTSTREIQDWFTECARLISGVGGQLVEWVTPLGLPIVQPYIKYKKVKPTGYESFTSDKFEKPNVLKQKNAFPPNFVHSLDSSHMMLTSLHCERAGITFVSVHDCYWTHPSTIHIMNKICREQFVALHSEPILENLSMFLYDKYSFEEGALGGDDTVSELSKKKLNKMLRQLPRTGNFDIRNVLNSIYFFS